MNLKLHEGALKVPVHEAVGQHVLDPLVPLPPRTGTRSYELAVQGQVPVRVSFIIQTGLFATR